MDVSTEALRRSSRPEVPMDAEEQFADVFAASWPRLYRTAYALSGDAGTAEDAVQAAFARAYASWERVRRADHPEAYLRRIVVNQVLTMRQRAWFRRERPQELVEVVAHVASAEASLVERDRVWAAVRALPPRQRAVVVLRYYEDLSEAEIAEALGCSRGTVKSQASAALANLRRAGIDPEGEES